MIRKARSADIDSILEIEQESFPRPWSRNSFEIELYKISGDFLVYDVDGIVAGYIVFWYILDEAELAVIAVSKKFRRQKIAEKLLKYCIEEHSNISIIYLEVEKTNEAAVALYEKFGFNINGVIKDYYGAGRNAFRMSLSVSEYRGD